MRQEPRPPRDSRGRIRSSRSIGQRRRSALQRAGRRPWALIMPPIRAQFTVPRTRPRQPGSSAWSWPGWRACATATSTSSMRGELQLSVAIVFGLPALVALDGGPRARSGSRAAFRAGLGLHYAIMAVLCSVPILFWLDLLAHHGGNSRPQPGITTAGRRALGVMVDSPRRRVLPRPIGRTGRAALRVIPDATAGSSVGLAFRSGRAMSIGTARP